MPRHIRDLNVESSDFQIFQIFIIIIMHYLQKYNKINIYRNYKKYKKKEIKQYITRKIVLSDQSSISFRVGHWHVQNNNMTHQLVTKEIEII